MKKLLTLFSTFAIVVSPTLAFVVSCGEEPEQLDEESTQLALKLIENYKTDTANIIEEYIKSKNDNLFIEVNSTIETGNKFLKRSEIKKIVDTNPTKKITKYSQLTEEQKNNLKADFETTIGFSELSNKLNSTINKNKYNSILKGITDILPSYSIDENNFEINYNYDDGDQSAENFSAYVKMKVFFNIQYINVNQIQESYKYEKIITFNINSKGNIQDSIRTFSNEIDTYLLNFLTTEFKYGWIDESMLTDQGNSSPYSQTANKGKILKPDFSALKSFFETDDFRKDMSDSINSKYFTNLNLGNLFAKTQVTNSEIISFMKNETTNLTDTSTIEGAQLFNLVFSKNKDISKISDVQKNGLENHLGLEFEKVKRNYDDDFLKFLNELSMNKNANQDFKNKINNANVSIGKDGYNSAEPFTQQILRSAGYAKITFDKIEIGLTSNYKIPIESFSTYISFTADNTDDVKNILETSSGKYYSKLFDAVVNNTLLGIKGFQDFFGVQERLGFGNNSSTLIDSGFPFVRLTGKSSYFPNDIDNLWNYIENNKYVSEQSTTSNYTLNQFIGLTYASSTDSTKINKFYTKLLEVSYQSNYQWAFYAFNDSITSTNMNINWQYEKTGGVNMKYTPGKKVESDMLFSLNFMNIRFKLGDWRNYRDIYVNENNYFLNKVAP